MPTENPTWYRSVIGPGLGTSLSRVSRDYNGYEGKVDGVPASLTFHPTAVRIECGEMSELVGRNDVSRRVGIAFDPDAGMTNTFVRLNGDERAIMEDYLKALGALKIGEISAWFVALGIRDFARDSLNPYQNCLENTSPRRIMARISGGRTSMIFPWRDNDWMPKKFLGRYL